MAKRRPSRAAAVVSSHSARSRAARLLAEALESRDVPSTLEIQLIPDFDQFGNQYATIQVFRFDDGLGDRVTFGIFDTGASPVTYGWIDQFFFDELGQAIPVIPGATVTASGIGGDLTGLVSQPGTLLADGLHAFDLDAFLDGGESYDLSGAAEVGGVQAMIGTEEGSPDLPTITGTPIMNGGVAVLIDQYGYEIDFGALFPEFPEFAGLVLAMPDLFFVEPGRDLTPGAETTEVVRLPVEFLGIDNHLDPGTTVTESYNPIFTGVEFANTPADTTVHVGGQTLLFDTGAQLSVISTDLALSLGLDLDNPEFSIEVGGAGGTLTVGGYVIDSLTIPRDDDNNGEIDGELVFLDVPVFVLDIGADLDGIFGMNLLNPASEIIYDPNDPDGGPSVQMTFTTAPREGYDEDDLAGLDMLSGLFSVFRGSTDPYYLPGIEFNLDPTVAADHSAVSVNEGQSATNTGTFADANGDTITLTASVGTVTRNAATGTWSWSLPTSDGPGGPITVTVTANDGNGGVDTTTFTYAVRDVAPTVALAGGSQVNAHATYTLQLGNVTDPGTDTISGYRVNWGDGTSTNFTGSPAGQSHTHVYLTAGNRTITVRLANEDGSHAAAGTKTITVTAPNLRVRAQATPTAVAFNSIVKFAITFSNTGTADATGVFATFNMPTGMRFLADHSSPGWENIATRRFRLDVGTLAAGESRTVVVRTRLVAQFAPGTILTSTIRIGDDGLNGPDLNLANNVFRAKTRVK